MYIFLFICTLLIPVAMAVLGNRYRHIPPKNINIISGYRSKMSMLNQETWEYAHRFIGRLWLYLGIILSGITIIIMIIIRERNDFEMLVIYLTVAQLIIMGLTVLPTEIKLHNVFQKSGKRK